MTDVNDPELPETIVAAMRRPGSLEPLADDERSRVAERMWAAFDDIDGAVAGEPEASTTDEIRFTEAPPETGQRMDRWGWGRLGLVAAAATVVVAAGLVVMSPSRHGEVADLAPSAVSIAPSESNDPTNLPLAASIDVDEPAPGALTIEPSQPPGSPDGMITGFTDDPDQADEPDGVWIETEPTVSRSPGSSPGWDTVTADLAGLEVSFDVPTDAAVGGSPDRLVLGPTADAPPGDEVVVARVGELFDGQPADDFFAESGLEADPTDAVFDGEPIDSWVVSVDGDAALAEGCAASDECVTVGTSADGDDLDIRAGLFADVRVIPTSDGSDDLVVISHHFGLRLGTANDPTSVLRDQIVETLTFPSHDEPLDQDDQPVEGDRPDGTSEVGQD
ncbi:MAG: hypothetical protein AAGD33_23830 [Actinomycetota bacterium]